MYGNIVENELLDAGNVVVLLKRETRGGILNHGWQCG